MGDVFEDKRHSAESPPAQCVSRLSIPSTKQNEDKLLEEQKLKESKQDKSKKSHTSRGHFSFSTNSPTLSSLKRPLRHFLVAAKPFSPVKHSKFKLDNSCNSNTPLQLGAQKFLQLSNNLLKDDQSGVAVPNSKEVKTKVVDLSFNESTETGSMSNTLRISSKHGTDRAVEEVSLGEQYQPSDNLLKADLSGMSTSEKVKTEVFDFSFKSSLETGSLSNVFSENSLHHGTEVPNSGDVKTKVFNLSLNESPEFISMCNDSIDSSSWQGIEVSNDVKTEVLDISLDDFTETDSMCHDSTEKFSQQGTKLSNEVKTKVFDISFIESLESHSMCNHSTKKFSQQGTTGPNSEDVKTKFFDLSFKKTPETNSICENYSQHRSEGSSSKDVKTKVFDTSLNEPPETNSMCNVATKNSSQHKTESVKEETTVVERHVSVTFLPVPHSEMQLLPPQQGKINHKERSNVEESKDDLCLREIEAGEQASPKKRQQLSGPSKETKEEPELELEEDTEKSNGKRPALEEDSAEPNKKHRPLKCERCKQLMLSNNLELSNDISCEFCSKEFDCYCALEFHKVTIHIEKKPHCALCCKVITGPKLSEHLQSHGLTSQDLMITCDDCNIYGYKWSNRTFFKKNTFCTHLQGKDTLYNNVLIKCPKCPAEFDRLEFFESHREKMH